MCDRIGLKCEDNFEKSWLLPRFSEDSKRHRSPRHPPDKREYRNDAEI